MAIVYLGLGSNIGDRKSHLIKGVDALVETLGPSHIRVSSVYETAALLPPGSPADWNQPFYNIAIEIETDEQPLDLLKLINAIEVKNGRTKAARWAPRTLDIDILWWEGVDLQMPQLKIPHEDFLTRAFALDPVAELAPSRVLSDNMTALQLARRLPQHQPQLMTVLNVTPDSFSDGGRWNEQGAMDEALQRWKGFCTSFLDIGGESTRPGATPVRLDDEWARVESALNIVRSHCSDWLKPRLSVDTRNPVVAARSLELGVDIINDVSHCSNPEMLAVLAASRCQVVLMHSLTVPADPSVTFAKDSDVVQEMIRWMEARFINLEKAGISRDRLIFDPGIGFGKTTQQTLQILQRMKEFHRLQVPIMVGHSRKSFLKNNYAMAAQDRDLETLAISLYLQQRGVEILRIHNPEAHRRMLLAWNPLQ
jgi:2-amino-4-hydroxy-6-hydroxymethyldihydropteridine diphosphokinase/dihydropteroate synthase